MDQIIWQLETYACYLYYLYFWNLKLFISLYKFLYTQRQKYNQKWYLKLYGNKRI